MFGKTARPRSAEEATTYKPLDTANTLNAFDIGETRCNELAVTAVGADLYNQEITGETAATLTAASEGTNTSGPKVVYENHPNDSRVKEMGEVCTSLTGRCGTGGGNVPIVGCSLGGGRRDVR